MPYTFYAESKAGEMKYTIGLYKGKNESEEIVEVTPETWDRLLRAQQVEHLNTLAVAVDGDHAVGNGQIGTIAARINEIANEVVSETGDVLYASGKKDDDEEGELS